ncbi:hypothetical protein BKA65DRAFT_144901, partial [Rhexocercosporidium sp. MPI-PUGE-AT-0058]
HLLPASLIINLPRYDRSALRKTPRHITKYTHLSLITSLTIGPQVRNQATMSFDLSAKTYCRKLGHEIITIQASVDGTSKKYTVHKNLLLLLHSSLEIPCRVHSVVKLANVTTEVLDEVVSWLYHPSRTYQLVGLPNLSVLLGIYKFACNYAITDLKHDCFHALTKHHDLIKEMEELFDRGTREQKDFYSYVLNEILDNSDGIEAPAGTIVTHKEMVNVYMFGLKLRQPLLRNMAMDCLRKFMDTEHSVLSLQEVRDIFYRANAITCRDAALIKLFCGGLIHYQLTDVRCPPDQRLTDITAQQYFQIPGVSAWYATYTSEFLVFRANEDPEQCWDPRAEVWDYCIWHNHELGDKCHRSVPNEESEHTQTMDTESIEENSDEEIFDTSKEMAVTNDYHTNEFLSAALEDATPVSPVPPGHFSAATTSYHTNEFLSVRNDESITSPAPFRRSSESPEPTAGESWHGQLIPHDASVEAAEAKAMGQALEKNKAEAEAEAGNTESENNKKRKADEEPEVEQLMGRGQRRKIFRKP